MNRKSIIVLVAGAMAMLSGCLMFYTGSEEGRSASLPSGMSRVDRRR